MKSSIVAIKRETYILFLIVAGAVGVMVLVSMLLAIAVLPLILVVAPVALAVGIVMFLAIMWHPEIALALLQGGIAIPIAALITVGIEVPDGITLAAVSVSSVAGLGLLLMAHRQRINVYLDALTLVQMVFMLVVIVGATYSWNQLAWEKTFQFILANVVSFVVAAALDTAQRKRLYLALLVIAVLVACGIAVNFLQGNRGLVAGRYDAFGMDVITGARTVALGIIIVLFAPFQLRYRFILLSVLGAGLLLAATRAPILALLVSVVISGAVVGASMPFGRISRQTIYFVLAGIVALGLILVIAVNYSSILVTDLWGPFRLINDTTSNDPNITTRFSHWERALAEFEASPLVGSGTGGYGVSDTSRDAMVLNWPHNMSLEVMAEFGFIGLFIYVSLFFVAIVDVRSAYVRSIMVGDHYHSREILLVTAILVFAIVNAHFSGLLHTNRTVWMALGLIQGLAISAHLRFRSISQRSRVSFVTRGSVADEF